jgi:integration host factor subunit beta
VTRHDLVMRLAKRMKIDPDLARSYVESFLETVLDILGTGERIEIRGFGVFQIEERAARVTRNPRSGETVIAKPKRTVKFKMGKELRDRVRSTTPQSEK